MAWLRGSAFLLASASILWWTGSEPAYADCLITGAGATCTGDFAGESISNASGGNLPSSVTSVTVDNLTSDVGPAPDSEAGAINLGFDFTAPISPIDLTVSSDDFSLLTTDESLGVSIVSTVSQVGTSTTGEAGRAITFLGEIDIGGQLSAGQSAVGVLLSTRGGDGTTPSATGDAGGDGGAGGAVSVTGSGTYGVTGDGFLSAGIDVDTRGGDGGAGQNNGGNGGSGGQGGAVSLNANGTWMISTGGDLSGDQEAGVFVRSRGGTGGDGGDGNNEGTAAMGGAGGDISFDGDSSGAWIITSAGVPGFFLVSEGGQAGSVGGGTPDKGGDGGQITKNDGSGVQITTSGDNATGFIALSRGGQGTRTNDNYGEPGAGGAITITDSWDITTAGTLAHGIAAQSLGGSPESGSDRAISGDGGDVTIDIAGTIQTSGDQSFGIVAQSVGGHDGSGGTETDPGVEFGVVDNTSTGASGLVTVKSSAAITTTGEESAGIGIQSIGGGGGALGSDFEDFFSGSSETLGGAGGSLVVENSGDITTTNAASDAILAQSIGGAGGVGSSSTSDSTLGSNSKNGSDGGAVIITNSGTILAGGTSAPVTQDSSSSCGGACSVGIFAQSVGGGGGKGHTASGAFSATGGMGGEGGSGGSVTIFNSGDISTFRDHSAAIESQSIGGGGGQGGGAVSGGTFSHSVGGTGGTGGNGGAVLVQHDFASLLTFGDNSDGIHAHSVGGGGGRGGYAIAGSVEGASFAVGGKGGAGGDGGAVTVCLDQAGCTPTGVTSASSTSIETSGDNAKGVFAYSVGGGGGNGGFSVAASAGIELSEAIAIGGNGGGGGKAEAALIGGDFGSITTAGDDSTAIKALSVGGGGGNGGLSIAGTATISVDEGLGFGVSLGGQGANGGAGGMVDIAVNGDVIKTSGDRSSGVFGQSVGGGGGNGGASVSLGISSPQTAQIGIAVGGSGSEGGDAGDVSVTYAPGSTSGLITTEGDSAHGLLAQSVAGGGGHGGASVSGGVSGAESTSLSISLGGSGGGGGNSGAVSLSSGGTVTTGGTDSHGIFAQSAGGSGGYGGMTVAGAVSGSSSISASVAVGDGGGSGGSASTVTVTNDGSITVTGEQSKGIVAQSVGGAGGHGSLSVTGAMVQSEDSKTANVTVGGSGGRGGSAAAVEVTNNAAVNTGTVGTTSNTSLNQEFGILAQSISGNGGYGGMALTAQDNQGQKSAEVSIGGSGAGASGAGTVLVNSNAAITTNNDDSAAIMAQSIGGNGGAGGMTVNAQYTDKDTDSNVYSLAIGGSGGEGATSEEVKIIHSAGDITTMGANSGGIVAQSIGGGGGHGGSNVAYTANNNGGTNTTNASSVSLNLGGSGSDGSAAGTVFVEVTGGSIVTGAGDVGVQTVGDSSDRGHGIFALSQGGGGGSGGIGMVGDIDTSQSSSNNGGTLTMGGSGGSGSTGNDVTVSVSDAPITTNLINSHGILAQSIGGGGGNGGIGIKGDVTTSGGKGFVAALGAQSGQSSGAKTVAVTVSSAITTQGLGSAGIVAQSIGGGGGDGGAGIDGSVTSSDTKDSNSSLYSLALGASGAQGSSGGDVNVTLSEGGSITTNATLSTPDSVSHGILAQSVGGGGGRGGYGISGDVTTNESSGRTEVLAVGGPGGGGGAGGEILINHEGTISVAGDFAAGIMAQSIGGGGGTGGFSIGGELKSSSGLQVAVGGSGGQGGGGGAINNFGNGTTLSGGVATAGDFGHAVVLQSIGGGGGVGAVGVGGSFSDSGSDKDVALIVGGSGGSGGAAGTVYLNFDTTATEGDAITTAGTGSIGILAQAIGGGGGAAASALNGTVSTDSSAKNLTLALGGSGGGGGDAELVSITNIAPITTGTNASTAGAAVTQSFGILAQSIGGGGGQAMHGGALDHEGDSLQISMTIGAASVDEGDADRVIVTNTAAITTYGVDSHGVVAQSISGGGGVAGVGTQISAPTGATMTHGATLGGTTSSNQSFVNNDTSVTNQADITTYGEGAHGILAQSIIGGGGYSSSLFGIEQSLTTATDTGLSVSDSSGDTLRLGGTNVIAKPSGSASIFSVIIENEANIATSADGAVGILAQSVGGGGGVAYDGTYNAKTDIPFSSLSVDYTVGGSGVGGDDNDSRGAGANAVTVNHIGGTIVTPGFGGAGIYAQSVGGGGGRGFVGGVVTGSGAVTVGGTGNTEGDGADVAVNVTGGTIIAGVDDNTYAVSAFGVFAQSVGGGGGHGGVADFQNATVGTKLATSNSGLRNTDGAGGAVEVNIDTSVSTLGNSSVGVFAQSVGGGGGVIGTTTAGTAVSLGSNGGNGSAGDVTVNVDGSVSTIGQAAHGIFAQSASGDNHKGQDVTLTVSANGTVSASGAYAYGAWLDAPGGDGNGTVTIQNSGAIIGGTETGAVSIDTTATQTATPADAVTVTAGLDPAGVVVTNAETASISNEGWIGTADGVSGDAVRSFASALSIDNSGTLVGDLHGDDQQITLQNLSGGTLLSGETYDLGETGLLVNAGTLEILGDGTVGTTTLTGDFEQDSTGVWVIDIDLDTGSADALAVSGTAVLGGQITPTLTSLGTAGAGLQSLVIVSADEGVETAADGLSLTESAVAGYALALTDQELALTYDIDFAVTEDRSHLIGNEREMADFLQRLYEEGELDDVLLTYANGGGLDAYSDALRRSVGEVYAQSRKVMLFSTLDFEDASSSCDVHGRTFAIDGREYCAFVQAGGRYLEADESSTSQGFDSRSFSVAGGLGVALDPSTQLEAAFQYVNHSITTSGVSSSNGNTIQALVRAKREVHDFWLGAYFGGGIGWFDVDRTLPFGGTVSEEQNVPFINGGAEVSRRFGFKSFFVEPRFSVGVTHFLGNTITEDGTTGFELAVDAEAQSIVYARPAVRFGTRQALSDDMVLGIDANVGLTSFLSGDSTRVDATFATASSSAGTFESKSSLDDLMVDLDLGVGVASGQGWNVRAEGFARLSGTITQTGGGLRLGLQF